MRKTAILLGLVLGIILACNIVTSAQITQVTNNYAWLSSENNGREIAKDSNGNYYVTHSGGAGWNHIFVEQSTDGGASWKFWNGTTFGTTGTPTAIENSGNYNQEDSSMAIDGNNNVYVMWHGTSASSPSYNQIRVSKYTFATGTWSSPVNITTGNYSQYSMPSIAIDNSNGIYATWNGKSAASSTYDQIRYSKSTDGGTTWSAPVDLTSGNYSQSDPSMAIDGNNNINIVWYGCSASSPSDAQIRYIKSIDGGNTWAAAANITSGSGGGGNGHTSIVIDNANNLHVAWGNGRVKYMKYTALSSTWSLPLEISSGSIYTYNAYPSIGVDNSSNIYVVWTESNSAPNKIRFTRYTASSGMWSVPTNLTSGSYDQKYPSMEKGASGIVWRGLTNASGVGAGTDKAMFSNSLPGPFEVLETPTVKDIDNNGDGRDIKVTFYGTVDETNISSYRVFVVPSSQAGSFNEPIASGLANSRYFTVAKNGNVGSHIITLSLTLQDSNGIPITNGTTYKVFVLLVGQNGYPNFLSPGSLDLNLSATFPVIIPVSQATSSTTADLSYPNANKVVRDGSGNYYITYTATYNGYSHIFVRKSDDGGVTWKYWNGTSFVTTGSEVPVETGNYSQDTPAIAVDSTNNIHLVWSGKSSTSTTYYQVRYSQYNGTWSAPINITSESYHQYEPAIALDGTDIHMVWYGYDAASPSDTRIRYSKYTGTWSAPVDISPSGWAEQNPSIAIDSNHTPHIVWNNNGGILYSKYISGSWTPEHNIQGLYFGAGFPTILIDSSNTIHVVYYGYDGIVYTKYTSSWSNPILLTTSGSFPSMALDAGNNIYVVWGGTQIGYTKYTGTWSAPVNITSGDYNQKYPCIVNGATGMGWQGTTNQYGISTIDTGLMFYTFAPSVPASGTSTASDIANYGDGRDIQVTFTGAVDETNISGYRIFVVKNTDAPSFGSATASGLASSRFVAVAVTTAGASHTVTLTQNLLDSSGAGIQNGVAYKVFVLSVGKTGYSDTLSSGSSNFTLAMTIQGITTTTDAVKDLANNGDGRDIRVMFKGSLNEANIQDYRIMVVRTGIAGSFDVSTASGLAQASYLAEPVKGNGRMHLLYLTQSLQNSEGNPITGGVPYSVYVLAVGKTGYSSILTNLGDVTLSTNNEGYKITVPTPTVVDIANNNNGSDIRLTFKKPQSEVNIASYRIIVSTVDLTVTTAASIPAAGYKQITPTAKGVGYTVSMGANQTDNGGVNAIQNNTAYKVYILAIGKNGYDNVLSIASKSITLSQYVPGVYPVRGLNVEKVGAGHESFNIKVTFAESTKVTDISEYRILIVPSGTTLTQVAADGVTIASRYQIVAVTGRLKSHIVTLDTGKSTYDGSSLAAGDYRVYVQTVGLTGYGNKLSVASGIVKLD